MRVFVLTGPTGVGKTEVAAVLAQRFGLELISADSRQVYTWLDIGTDKPSRKLRSEVKFHMIDMVEPDRVYSAADYARDAIAVMRRLTTEGKRFIMVGGSGLYIRAVFESFFEAPKPDKNLRKRLESHSSAVLYSRLKEIDPERALQLHPHDRQRVMRALEIHELTGKTMTELTRASKRRSEFEPYYLVLTVDREMLRHQLSVRFDTMMKAGLLDEVRRLQEAGFGKDTYVANAYGYAELLAHLQGEITLEKAVELAKTKTRAYARRQLTWCRSLKEARWFEYATTEDAVRKLAPMLAAVFESETQKTQD